MTSGMPLRSERVLRYVNAFCPRCHEDEEDRPLDTVERLSGYLAESEDRVWLVRGCPTHGRVVTLYDESPEILEYLEQWTAPTKVHVPDTPGNYAPVPAAYLEGLGEMQTQHTCILLEDITETCNLRCPTCYAGSAPPLTGVADKREILANVDQRLDRENGRLDVLMISGGEPTIHPQFADILTAVIERPIVRIIINTNGIEASRNDELLDLLATHRERVELYLQFDGFRLDTHKYHRNADLRRMKQQAIDRLSDAGVFMTLTMTAALGVNDDEIGDVLIHALKTPFVGGVSIQPQFGSGRSAPIDPMERLTHTGVLARLEEQTGGLVTWRDLTALPCSHPHCCSVGYMIQDDGGQWRSLVSMIGPDNLKAHLGLVSNRIADTDLPATLRTLLKESLMGLLSEQSSLTHPTVSELIRNVCENCDLGLGTLLRMAGTVGGKKRMRQLLATRIKRITVKPFMDMNTMLEERLLQCCVHVGTRSSTQDQCAPFCAVQAWSRLADMKLPTAPRRNSIPLEVR
jgi:uncharacterized radical SAM superfamily Fe-S cluster-containing enzyme